MNGKPHLGLTISPDDIDPKKHGSIYYKTGSPMWGNKVKAGAVHNNWTELDSMENRFLAEVVIMSQNIGVWAPFYVEELLEYESWEQTGDQWLSDSSLARFELAASSLETKGLLTKDESLRFRVTDDLKVMLFKAWGPTQEEESI